MFATLPDKLFSVSRTLSVTTKENIIILVNNMSPLSGGGRKEYPDPEIGGRKRRLKDCRGGGTRKEDLRHRVNTPIL